MALFMLRAIFKALKQVSRAFVRASGSFNELGACFKALIHFSKLQFRKLLLSQ